MSPLSSRISRLLVQTDPLNLSTGAKAGIGVGCCILLVALIPSLILWLHLKSRKRSAPELGATINPIEKYDDARAEMVASPSCSAHELIGN